MNGMNRRWTPRRSSAPKDVLTTPGYSFIPDGFEAYARVFHPPGYRPRRRGSLEPNTTRKWADLARERGISLSPDISFSEVSGLGPEDQHKLDELAPMDGELPPKICDALVAVLGPHTRTLDHCWFCLWEGERGFLEPRAWAFASRRR
jgi:hypothetical protein